MSNETYPKEVAYKYKYFEGLEIGAVSVKWLRIAQDGAILKEIVRHEGYPREKIKQIFERYNSNGDSSVAITGSVAKNFYDFSYYSEAECFDLVRNVRRGTGEFIVQQLERMGLSLKLLKKSCGRPMELMMLLSLPSIFTSLTFFFLNICSQS